MTELANAAADTVDDAPAAALVAAPADGATFAVDTTGLTKRYGTLTAVDDHGSRRCRAGRSSGSSARTAPASRRRSR